MIIFEVWRECNDPCCPVADHYEGSYSTKENAEIAIANYTAQDKFEVREVELDNPIWQIGMHRLTANN
jgi:hypothetical protein